MTSAHDDLARNMIEKITATLSGIAKPTDRALATSSMLDSIPTLQRGLREIRQEAVLQLRRDGLSHGEVAAELGISRARAQQIAEGKTSGRKVKPAEPAEE